VFSTLTGREEYRIQGQAGLDAVYSPDGRAIAIGGPAPSGGDSEAPIVVIDSATGRETRRFPGHKEMTDFLAFSGNDLLVTGGRDAQYRVWDLKTGKQVRQFPRIGHYYPKAEGVSPDGRYFACAEHGEATDEPLHVYELETGREVFTTKVPTHGASLLFAPNSRSLVSFSSTTIRRFELPTGRATGNWASPEPIGVYACSNEGVYRLKFTDGIAILDDVATGRPAESVRLPVCMENRAAPSDFYVVGDNTQLAVWDLATGKPRHPTAPRHGTFSGVAFSADGQIVTADSQSVHFWKPEGREVRVQPCRTYYSTYASSLAPDGRSFVNGDGRDVYVWDARTGQNQRKFQTEANVFTTFALTCDGRFVAYPSWRNLRVWDVEKNRQVCEARHQGSQRTAAAFSPDGGRLFVNDRDGTICEWDVAAGTEVRRLEGRLEFMLRPQGGIRRIEPRPGHMGTVHVLRVSPDGKRLFSAGGDRTLRVWELATGMECGLLTREIGPDDWRDYPPPPHPLDVSRDGSIVATTGRERSVIDLWDVRGQTRLASFAGHRGAVTAIAFSPDGRRLISGSVDALGYIWEVPSIPQPLSTKLDNARATALWSDLADVDAAKAFRAVGAWIAAPDDAVATFRRLRPADKPVDGALVGRLIVDLDSNQFAVRDRASKDLEAMGPAAGRHMRQALAKSPSPEVTRRLEALLVRCPDEDLRGRRAVEVLEALGTPAAKALLGEWSRAAPASPTARDSADALVRLGRR
jgi:WD40 repeat protein